MGGLSLYRGPEPTPVAAQGHDLSVGNTKNGQPYTFNATFDRYAPTKNGQVKWKVLTRDGYPLTVVLEQGLSVPLKMRPGRYVQITATPIAPGVVSLRSADDVTPLPDHETRYQYVGTFQVKNEEGYASLPTGERFLFHAFGYEDGVYNFLTLGFDENEEGVALELTQVADPKALRTR